jgi:hypothetical protein
VSSNTSPFEIGINLCPQKPVAPAKHPDANPRYLKALEALEAIDGSTKIEMVEPVQTLRRSDRQKPTEPPRTYNFLRVLAIRNTDPRFNTAANRSILESDPHPFAILKRDAFSLLSSENGVYVPRALREMGWQPSDQIF